ncbi:MAG: hypothetical protein QM760_17735 [Nibricoccus sp.]
MIRTRTFSFSILAALCCALPSFSSAQSSIIANAPVKNFRLPSFNDQGNRTSLLRGSEARYISSTQIDIIELNFAQFPEDGSTEADNILLAPSATVLIKSKDHTILTGKESVRLIGKGIDATGENWTFDNKGHNDQRLTMNKNVRVVFHAELKGILD